MSFDVLVFDGGVQRRVTASSLTDVNIVSGITTELISAGGFATTGYVDSAVSGAMASAGLGSAAVSSVVSGMLTPYPTSAAVSGIIEDMTEGLTTSAAVSAMISAMPSVDSGTVNALASAVVSGMVPSYGYTDGATVSSIVSGIVPGYNYATVPVVSGMIAAYKNAYAYNPIDAVYQEYTSTGESVYQLSTLVPDIVFVDKVTNLESMYIRLRSGNPSVSGTVALELTSSENVIGRFNLYASSLDQGYVVEINPMANGELKLHRNTSSSTDTLYAGESVQALVTVIKGVQSI